MNIGVKNEQDRHLDPWFNLRPSLFLHDQEPVLYLGQKERWEKLRFKLSPFDKRLIFLHSEKNSPELEQMTRDLDLVPCYWFSNAALAIEWYQNERWTLHTTEAALKYKFSGFNRLISYQRIYRPVLTAMVTDIVEPKYLRWSCSLIDPANRRHVLEQTDTQIPDHHKKLLERYKGQKNPVRINMNFSELDDKKNIQNTSPSSNAEYFRSTFCHIVTETLFYDSTVHLTEKSFRPIVNRRPFILAGPPGSLAYLRSYGFKTFSDFWDESYDQETDPHKRLDLIQKLIADLNKLDLDQMESLLKKMNDVLSHNYEHFYNKFPILVKEELIQNLNQAVVDFNSKAEWKGWILQTLDRVDDTRIKTMLESEAPEGASLDIVRNELKTGNTENAELHLHRFLVKHLGASRDDTKETLLAKIEQILR